MSAIRATLKRLVPEALRRRIRARISAARARRAVAERAAEEARAIAAAIARHPQQLAARRGARPIRVLFTTSRLGSWKVEAVLEAMLADPAFRPAVLVMPVVRGDGVSTAESERRKLLAHLARQPVEVIDVCDLDLAGTQARVREIDPDLVFFTNPHGLSGVELQKWLCTEYLSCYVPYSHEVVEYGGNRDQYDQLFHNLAWQIFVPHDCSAETYQKAQRRKGANVTVTGYPCCEPLLDPRGPVDDAAWPAQDRPKRRIIWAPHWIVSERLSMATFYDHAETIRRIAGDYRDAVQWAMRPHPLLMPTLEARPDWGPARTAEYFGWWRSQPHTRIEEGDYVPLFRGSDAIMHDSGSFLAEYLYLDRPALYLRSDSTSDDYLNAFGRRALAACEIARDEAGIRRFVEQVIAGEDPAAGRRAAFRSAELVPSLADPPSRRICAALKAAFHPVSGEGRGA